MRNRWSDEANALFMKLDAEGLGWREIAERMQKEQGMVLTRSAILGQRFRNKAAMSAPKPAQPVTRLVPYAPRAPEPKASKTKRAKPVVLERVSPIDIDAEGLPPVDVMSAPFWSKPRAPDEGVLLLDLKARACRAPLSLVASGPYDLRYCGKPQHPGSSYCDECRPSLCTTYVRKIGVSPAAQQKQAAKRSRFQLLNRG